MFFFTELCAGELPRTAAQPVDDVLKALASGDPEGAGELAKRMLANGHKYSRTGPQADNGLMDPRAAARRLATQLSAVPPPSATRWS